MIEGEKRSMSLLSPKRRNKGWTLIELLVATALSMIVLSAAMYFLITVNKRTSLDGVYNDMRQNAMISLKQISRVMKMAGAGIRGGIIRAYDKNGDSLAYLPVIYPYDNGSTTPDSVFVRLIDGDCKTTITKRMPNSSAELCVADPSCFQQKDLILITDGRTCSMLQVSHVQIAAKKLQHNPGVDYPYNPPGGKNIFPPGGYGPGAWVIRIQDMRIKIDNSDPKRPYLKVIYSKWPAPDEEYLFADNIENFQITPPVANATLYTVSITIRSDKKFPGKSEYPDGYLRFTTSTKISMRNIE